MPVTTPVAAFIVAYDGEALVQTPPAGAPPNAVVEPTQTVLPPVIGVSGGITVTSVVTAQDVGKV